MFIYELFEQIHILLCLEFCTPGRSDCKQGSTKAVARWTSTNIFSSLLSLIVQSAFTYLNLSSRIRTLLFLHLYSYCTALKNFVLSWKKVQSLQSLLDMFGCMCTLAHSHTGKLKCGRLQHILRPVEHWSGQIPGSHGLSSGKVFLMPTLEFMLHYLILSSGLFSGSQEIHELTIQWRILHILLEIWYSHADNSWMLKFFRLPCPRCVQLGGMRLCATPKSLFAL